MKFIKYSFPRPNFVFWKGFIAEKLVENYFGRVLGPKLKEEGWDFVIFVLSGETYISPLEIPIIFLYNNMLPTPTLLRKFKDLKSDLGTPDGFLLKLRNTGKSMPLKVAIDEIGAENYSFGSIYRSYPTFREIDLRLLKERGYVIEKWFSFDVKDHNENELLPIVDGEVEVVEIKSGKSRLTLDQEWTYRNVLDKGYTIHLFKVKIISFEKNQFEIEENVFHDFNQLQLCARTRIKVSDSNPC